MKHPYNKQILRYGVWKHPQAPGGKLEITKEFAQKLIKNFERTPFSPILRGHVRNDEAEKNPNLIIEKNIKSLSFDDKGINANFEVDEGELDKYSDVSASIDPKYTDHETGEFLGPVLKHVAFVLDPYIKGLDPFVKLKDEEGYLILLSDIKMADETKKEEKPIVDPNKSADETETGVTTPTPAAKPEETKPVESSEELVQQIVELQEKVKAVETQALMKEVESDFNELKSKGKVLPTQKDAYIALSSTVEPINLADGSRKTSRELLNEFIEKLPVFVNMSATGVNPEEGDENTSEAKIKEEIRLSDPNLSDEQVNAKYDKHKDVFKKYAKSN